jgi:hypothetical protein
VLFTAGLQTTGIRSLKHCSLRRRKTNDLLSGSTKACNTPADISAKNREYVRRVDIMI